MRRVAWLLTLAVGVCLAVRVVYIIQYARSLPFLWGPVGDSVIYLEQAAHVRAGEHGDATLLAFSPLYGYALAVIQDPVAVAVVQLLLGCVMCGLLFVVVNRLLGGDALAALVSSICFTFYGGALFFESKVLSDSLGLLLAAGAQTLFLLPQFRRGGVAIALFTGATIAFSVLARASLVFSAPLFVLAALLPFQRRLLMFKELTRWKSCASSLTPR